MSKELDEYLAAHGTLFVMPVFPKTAPHPHAYGNGGTCIGHAPSCGQDEPHFVAGSLGWAGRTSPCPEHGNPA